jgi:hypothetical protein
MKKHLFTLVSLLILLTPCFCQTTVPSSCNAPDSIKAQFSDDALRLAITNLFDTYHINSSKIIVPQRHVDTVMKALMAVYNAPLPYRDTVFKKYKIHTLSSRTLNAFNVYIDTAHLWAKQWRAGNTLTGDDRIDNYLSRFQFFNKRTSCFGRSCTVSFQTTQKLNIRALVDSLKLLSQFIEVYPESGTLVGNMDIFYTVRNNVKQLIFWHGEGDCPAGCIDNWYWYFSVFPDCSVRYDGESPRLLETQSVPDGQIKLQVSPNPTFDVLHIQLAETNLTGVRLFDIQGRLIKEKTVNGTVSDISMDIQDLPNGRYLLKVVTTEGDVYRKVMKIK